MDFLLSKHGLIFTEFDSIDHGGAIGYNFEPLKFSSDPLISVEQVHCTHSDIFQNESLGIQRWLFLAYSIAQKDSM